jgi:mono/diheme cytochrome c family protein
LYDPTTHLVSTAATAQVNCASCHTPHGADPDAQAESTNETTGVVTVFHSLNTMATGAGELCLNCHAN